MTDPTQAKQVRTKGGGNVRKYSWPPTAPHEFTVTSVTSVLKAIPKEFLVGWAAKVTAEAAVRDFDIVKLMLERGDKKGAINHIKGARYRDMNDKADRGTIVHAAVDAYLQGKPLPQEEIDRRLDEAYVPKHMYASTKGMINGVLSFLDDTEPEIHQNESTVYSRTHEYAGTADLIATMHVGGSRQPAVIDFKTSKSIYDEVALQLCAYGRADFVGMDDGTEAPLIPDLATPIEYGIVVRPKADGSYERATFILTDDVFELFLALQKVAELHLEQSVLKSVRRP